MTGNDSGSDRFEALLRHSVRTAPMAEPPPDFARSMDKLVTGRAEDAGFEAWLTRIAVWTTVVTILGFLVSYIGQVVGYLSNIIGDAPWPLLISTLAILGMIKSAEFMSLVRHTAKSGPDDVASA